jgi:hypothetical protein
VVLPVEEDGDLARPGVAQGDAAGRHHGSIGGGRDVAAHAADSNSASVMAKNGKKGSAGRPEMRKSTAVLLCVRVVAGRA